MTIFGVLAIILGLLCMLTPLVTGMAVALMVGSLILIGGIVRIIWAFKAETLGRGLVRGAIGILLGIILTIFVYPLIIVSGISLQGIEIDPLVSYFNSVRNAFPFVISTAIPNFLWIFSIGLIQNIIPYLSYYLKTNSINKKQKLN